MIELFSPALFQAKTGFGSASHTPTFIVGLPRAGKTIVEGALSRHPRVHGAGELSLQTLVEGGLIVGLDPDLPAGFEEKIGKLDADEARILADTYLKEIVRYNPKSRFVLNTLPQNFQNIGVLHLLFPNAKFIHVKREPVDNCLFCFMKKFANPHTYSQDLGIMGAYYRCYAELMDHWKSIFPGKIHDVRYEDFVADPAATLNDVLDFLGLDLDPDMRAQTPTAGRGSVRAGHVTEPINESHVAYWRNYERHLAPLFEALGR
jgi:hypothetical protein